MFDCRPVCLCAALAVIVPIAARCEPLELVVVTASKTPQNILDVPSDISVVQGAELSLRGSHDLRSALALVAGVEAPSGGDAGPSSAVPSFWGLHEFDAFLLLVDGVPYGGAFNPSISALDLNDVQRIEVMRGPAPVMYGATSFVGVIQVLHNPAGHSANEALLAFGVDNSVRGAIAIDLPAVGNLTQSVSLNAERLGFPDKFSSVSDGHVLYRGSLPLSSGVLRLDLGVELVRDRPTSPIVRTDTGLNSITPINANYNPANAAWRENRYQAALSYDASIAIGALHTLLSIAHSDVVDRRGFLTPELVDDGSRNADSQNQSRQLNSLYFDASLTSELFYGVQFITGADLLVDTGAQVSANGEYFVPLSGLVRAPPTTGIHADEINSISDHRFFAGQYAQLEWNWGDGWKLSAGIRINETTETKTSAHIDGFDPQLNLGERQTKSSVRVVETTGISKRTKFSSDAEVVFYGDFRQSFKPAAVDFGPDYTPQILGTEDADSFELGSKGFYREFSYQIELFLQNFNNLVIARPDGSLANGGREQLKGIELETRLQFSDSLSLAANFAYHDARFTRSHLGLEGKQLTMSPHLLASAGLLYSQESGVQASIVFAYVGSRFLDEENLVATSPYVTLDATFGYRFRQFSVAIEGTNLTNARPPTSQSEFGSASYYLMPARTAFLRLTANLD